MSYIEDITGIILKGRYCIVEQIGRGGEGSMYLARDIELGIFRAVKEIPASCRKEAGLLRLLEHFALPKMIDYVETEEFCYIVMEYIRGKSLGQLIRDGEKLSIDDILKIGKVILNVLEYLHSRKPALYYGDLKPDNIIMTGSGAVYLVDFGSTVSEYNAGHLDNKGTVGYAAPEQYHGIINSKSDYYAFGKTILTLCGDSKCKYYIRCPMLCYVIIRCCRRDVDKRWENDEQLINVFYKIKPVKLKLRDILIPFCAFLCAIALILPVLPKEKNHLELEKIIGIITNDYYTLDYRMGGEKQRDQICLRIEKKLQRLLKIYDSAANQIRLLELLAYNGELSDRADKAELYYRQLITYEPDYKEGYAKYGLYLCRQARYYESREVYEQWFNYNKKEKNIVSDENPYLWSLWRREAGLVLGRSQKAFEK